MSDVRNPDPLPADDLPDPEEDELIAYLDGELDPADARRVEDRIDEDPAYRARADALKKTYDLLDYLPRPEPSATFATRTLDRIPTSRSSPEAAGPVPSGSAALPAPAPARPWAWAAGVAAAVVLALGAGYFAADAARTYFRTPGKNPDDIPLADLRVIENLPLYAVADDVEFVARLADPDLFGDDLAPDRPGPAAGEKPPAHQLDHLTRAFRALPPEQQTRVRELDRQLSEKEPGERGRLFRSLEGYAAWLDRLPDGERKGVLAAATPGLRLGVVQGIRERQWVAALPEAVRNHADPAKRADLIRRWKEDEADRRRAWHVARKNWEAFQKNDPPWPFNSPAMKKEVLEFVRAAYRTDARADERPRCRLTPGELTRLKNAQAEAEQGGGWAWYDYGRLVHEFGRRYETLPEPAAGKLVLELDDLWPKAREHFQVNKVQKRATAVAGKWPEFALLVWSEAGTPGKKSYTIPAAVSLGPSRPDEFKPAVQEFIKALEQKAPAEREVLRKLEGKWPEYPRELIRAAKQHDLSVPGAMPPGAPKEWDRLYGPRPAGKGGEE